MKRYKDISCDTALIHWRAVRESIRECLRRTPDHLLGWAPKTGMLTFGQLYVHFATSLDWWLTIHIKDGGKWIPSAQEPTDDRRRLDSHMVESFARMERYAHSADLTRTYEYEGELVSGNWVILHLLEHDTHHRGQIFSYLRINGIDPPGE